MLPILFKSTNAESIQTKQGVYKLELKHMVHQTYIFSSKSPRNYELLFM